MEQLARVELPEMTGSDDWVHQFVFDPLGRQVGLAYTTSGKYRIAAVDLSTGASPVLQVTHLPVFPRLMAFTGDGQEIMLVGQNFSGKDSLPDGTNPTVQALLYDPATLDVLWQTDVAGVQDGNYGSGDYSKPEENVYYQAGLAADPGMQRILIAHAEDDRLTTSRFQGTHPGDGRGARETSLDRGTG